MAKLSKDVMAQDVPNSIVVNTAEGKSIPVIAVKPYSAHKGDSYLKIVLRNNGKEEYTTHMLNTDDGGLCYGHYFDNFQDALLDFNKRGND